MGLRREGQGGVRERCKLEVTPTGSAGNLDVRLWEEKELIWGLIKQNDAKAVTREEARGKAVIAWM